MLRHMNKAAQQRERMEEDAMYDFEEIRKEDAGNCRSDSGRDGKTEFPY